MKAKSIILAATIAISFIIVSALIAFALSNQNSYKPETPYILKAKDNYVALYKDGKEIEKFKTVNYLALPEYDKNSLKRGIEYATKEEVYSAIEDFDG